MSLFDPERTSIDGSVDPAAKMQPPQRRAQNWYFKPEAAPSSRRFTSTGDRARALRPAIRFAGDRAFAARHELPRGVGCGTIVPAGPEGPRCVDQTNNVSK